MFRTFALSVPLMGIIAAGMAMTAPAPVQADDWNDIRRDMRQLERRQRRYERRYWDDVDDFYDRRDYRPYRYRYYGRPYRHPGYYYGPRYGRPWGVEVWW